VSEPEAPVPSGQRDELRERLAFSTDGHVPPRAIIAAVEDALFERYGPPSRFRELPAGLRLEMHPSIRRWFMVSDDDLFRYAMDVPGDLFSVPVRVTVHLPEDHWRLVIVTEEVILGGGIHGGNPGG
jgi:hypothetical protein